MFTTQQQNIELDPDAPTVDINADSGGIQARRIVDRLYAGRAPRSRPPRAE